MSEKEPRSEILKIAVSLAKGSGLNGLYAICEGCKSVSTGKINDATTDAHDWLKNQAVILRQVFDDLSYVESLQAEVERLKEGVDSVSCDLHKSMKQNDQLRAALKEVISMMGSPAETAQPTFHQWLINVNRAEEIKQQFNID